MFEGTTISALPVGAIVTVDGVNQRHLGGGRFEPVGEPMTKRFGPDDGEMTPGMIRAMRQAGQ